MKKLLFLLGGVLLLINLQAQKIEVKPYYIGDRVSDLSLKPLFNYSDTSANLSSFGHKLIILDFWGIHCSDCVAMFPVEDSLQRPFSKDLQFILITTDSYERVKEFMENWKINHHTQFNLPIVTNAIPFRDMFWQRYLPHYVWLSPNGKVLDQTTDMNIDANIIKTTIQKIKADERMLRNHQLPENMFHFPPMTAVQKQFLQPYQNQNKE